MSATALDTANTLLLPEDVQNLLFREARTANTFSDEPVSEEQIQAIYDLIKWAPTSMNTQPLRALVVRTPEGKERLLKHMFEGNKPKTKSAPVTVVLAADKDFHENLPKVFPHKPDAKDLFSDDEERLDTARLNSLLQVGYFIIGVRAAGLAAGPMTGFDNEGVDREFFGDRNWHSLVVVNIGKPGENPWYPRLPRLDYDEVVETV